LAETVEKEEGTSKWQLLSLFLVEPIVLGHEALELLRFLASPLAVPLCPPTVSSSALLSRSVIHLLYSFFMSTQPMSPYSLYAGYVAFGKDELAQRSPPSEDTSFKSFKWQQPPGNFVILVLVAISYRHLQGFRFFFLLPNPPCLTTEP